MDLLSEMEEENLEPDVISFNAAISSCAKSKEWERALELLSQMQLRKVFNSIFFLLASM